MNHSLEESDPARLPVIQLRIFRQRPGETHSVRIVSPEYGGLFTHWIKNRSEYCDPQGCIFSCEKLRQVYKGYGAAIVWDPALRLWIPTVFELTESLECDFRLRWKRGDEWTITTPRGRKGHNEAKIAKLVGSAGEQGIIDNFDILPCLINAYHTPHLVLGRKNPMPARTYLKAAKIAGPGELDHAAQRISGDDAQKMRELRNRLAGIGQMPNEQPSKRPEANGKAETVLPRTSANGQATPLS